MGLHERLVAWQVAHSLALAVYQYTRGWPVEERYGMTAQLRRAAFSVAANLAEGAAKLGPREFARYLDVSLGSLAELQYGLRLAHDLGYLPEADWTCLEAQRDRAGRLVWALYRSLKRNR